MPLDHSEIVRRWVLDQAGERIRMLRRCALASLHGVSFEVLDGGWPGYFEALRELRAYVDEKMPDLVYVDEDGDISLDEPTWIEDASGVEVPQPHVCFDRAAITRATFGELISQGGM